MSLHVVLGVIVYLFRAASTGPPGHSASRQKLEAIGEENRAGGLPPPARAMSESRVPEQDTDSQLAYARKYHAVWRPDDGEPNVGLVGRRKYKVLRNLTYDHPTFRPIEIPKGFVTDLASFPPPAFWATALVLMWACVRLLILAEIAAVVYVEPVMIVLSAIIVRLLIVFDPTDPKWRIAIVHDWGHKVYFTEKVVLDTLFRVGAVQDKVNVVDAWFAWVAVRLFGWWWWNPKAKKK